MAPTSNCPGGCIPKRIYIGSTRKRGGGGRIYPKAKRCLSFVVCECCERTLRDE